MNRAFLNAPVKIDRRKHRSHVKLFQALVEKYQAGAIFDQIEIKEFCQSAGVSRATFYRHHQKLTDIVMIQFLILIADFERKIDALPDVNFISSSSIVVAEIEANLDLIQLVQWSGIRGQVQELFSGTIRQILILRDYPKPRQQFISDFLGGAVLTFAQQLASAEEPIPVAEAQRLYRLLMPKDL